LGRSTALMKSGNMPNQLSESSNPVELRAYYERQGEEVRRSGQAIRCSEDSVTRVIIELLRSQLNSFQTILDVGCGANLDYDLFLAERGKDVVGVEFSLSFLRLAPRHPRIQLVQGNATSLPFADGAFEAAICSETVEHIPSDEAAVAELARVLRPKGLLVFTVPNLWNLERLVDMVRTRSVRIRMMEGHLREYSRRRVLRLLVPFFHVEHIAPVPFGWSGEWGPKLDRLVRSGLLASASKSIALVARRR
jgi:SAM-dependent methyltransferase